MSRSPHTEHQSYVAELTRSQAAIQRSLAALGDPQMREPSLLPGWSRDMLTAHLRFGAEAALRAVTGAQRGTDAVMYPGGEDQRNSEIESGVGRSARELVDDLASACTRIEALFASLPDLAWALQVTSRRGPVTVHDLLLQRWLDVEVHHVDLYVGYTSLQWPSTLVDVYLPGVIGLLPALRNRPDADTSVTGSWHFHRTDAPGEWTVHATREGAWTSEGHVKADCAVRGPGTTLLAFLLGRCEASELELFGDSDKAISLKRVFPGP